jgi:hypothetical protein
MKNTLFTLIPAALLGVGLAVASSAFSAANAASLSFKADDQRGSDSASVDIFAEDVDGGVKFTLTVNDPNNTADLSATYLNFDDSFNTSNITRIDGALDYKLDTNKIGNGNIGKDNFDLGIQLTGTGASGGLVTSKMFTIFGTDLDVNDILGQQMAVRLQAVGSGADGGKGSAKQYGIAPTSSYLPTTPPKPFVKTSVPEPASFAGLALVGGAMAFSRRRRSNQTA